MLKQLKCLMLCAGFIIGMGCSMTAQYVETKAPPKAGIEQLSKIKYKTLSVPYYGEIKVPVSMPDFTNEFRGPLLPFYYSETICAIAYLTGESSPPFGLDAYELIGLCSESKILVLAYGRGEEIKYWIYDDEGNPIEASADEVLNIIEVSDTSEIQLDSQI